MPAERRQALYSLLLLGLIWGSGYTLARYAVTHGVTPLGYAFWQAFGPACLLSIQLSRHQNKAPAANRKTVYFYLICGLLGIAIPNANMYFSAQHVPAGLLAVLINTTPLFTTLFAWLSGEEKPRVLKTLGMICCVAGLFYLFAPHFSLPKHLHSPWLLTALISPICFASCAVYISHKQPKTLSPLRAARGMMLAATFWLLPIVLWKHHFYVLWQPPYGSQDAVILLEIALSTLGYFILFHLIKQAGAMYYSLTGGVVACTGLFWGWLIFHERLNQHQLVAVMAIILGITLCTWRLVRRQN